jgi:hypothetical protein
MDDIHAAIAVASSESNAGARSLADGDICIGLVVIFLLGSIAGAIIKRLYVSQRLIRHGIG